MSLSGIKGDLSQTLQVIILHRHDFLALHFQLDLHLLQTTSERQRSDFHQSAAIHRTKAFRPSMFVEKSTPADRER